MKIIELRGVAKKYRRKTVFSNLSLGFESGKIYLLVGENGSGKTTLIKGVIGLLRFSAGRFYRSPARYAFLPEKIALPETVTVYAFLVNIGKIKKTADAGKKIMSLLEEWNVDGTKKIKELSKGMRQKVLIIQTLLSDVDLYLFDEPMSGLDAESRSRFLSLVRRLREAGKTLIISTHYPDLYPGDEIILLAGEEDDVFNQMSS
jgi:ABC-2 type transport system ATP-binding protein